MGCGGGGDFGGPAFAIHTNGDYPCRVVADSGIE
ncbi:Uncharacterised protein [Mycobacterium tuberculosis]|nr:Uncharacterised protein [Mycobacterium tuberculosis]